MAAMGIAASVLLSLALAAEADPHAEFAAQVEADFLSGQDGFSKRIDADALVQRAVGGLNLPNDFQQGMRQGIAKGGAPAAKEIQRSLAAGGSLKLLRVRPVGGEPRALFRFIH